MVANAVKIDCNKIEKFRLYWNDLNSPVNFAVKNDATLEITVPEIIYSLMYKSKLTKDHKYLTLLSKVN